MLTNYFKTLIAAGIIIVIAASCSSKATENKQAAVPSAALPVDVIIAGNTTVDQTEVIAGSLLANRTVDIMSELSKKIVEVSFKDGSYVQQGQTLYKLDDADIRARLRQLQAELNLAKINEQRLQELLKTETVRREEYDIALAKLQSLEAVKDLLLSDLSKTIIKAPFPGIAGISKVFKGSFVSPGMSLVSIQEQSTLKIQFSVSEKYTRLVKPGSKIEFTTESGTGKQQATVVSTEASVDQQSRNLLVQASFANPSGRLKAGMSAKVFFNSAAESAKGIYVPTEALIPGGSGYSVFLVKNGTAKITSVTISNRNEEKALISSGIYNGDTVMVSNILRAADGIPVSIVLN